MRSDNFLLGSNRTIPEVIQEFNTFKDLHSSYSNLKDGLDIQKESTEAQKIEVDSVIKKVWNELETFYNEEDIDSKRANAREWGVVYRHTTVRAKTVVLQLQMREVGVVSGITEVLLQDEASTPTNANETIFNTHLFGTLTVQFTGDEIQSYNSTIKVLEDANQNFVILQERVEYGLVKSAEWKVKNLRGLLASCK